MFDNGVFEVGTGIGGEVCAGLATGMIGESGEKRGSEPRLVGRGVAGELTLVVKCEVWVVNGVLL